MDRDETWHAGRPRPWLHCIRWGSSLTSPNWHIPQFPVHICCGQMAGWIKMPLCMEVGIGPGDFVLDGDLAPLPKRGEAPSQFSAHVYCGQTAGLITMALGMEVGLGLDHTAKWGPSSSPPKKWAEPPIFGPCLVWPNGWMHQDITWYGGSPRPTRHCVRRGPSPSPEGIAPAPIFGQCPLWPNGWMD